MTSPRNLAVALLLLASSFHAAAQPPETHPLDIWWWRNSYPSADNLRGIAYGNGTFVAVSNAGIILRSPDGLSWSEEPRTSATMPKVDVAYANGRFVMIDGSATLLVSSDGRNWAGHSAEAERVYRIAAINNQFFALGTNRQSAVSFLLRSTNAVTWTRSVVPRANDVAYGNGAFVVVGQAGAIHSSRDAVEWTWRESGVTASISRVTFGAGRFIATTPAGILSSIDGVHWERGGLSEALSAVAFIGNQFVGLATRGGTVWTSPDGTNWSARPSGTPETLFAIASDGNRMVAVGGRGAVSTSTDGRNWMPLDRGFRRTDLNDVIFANGRFVAVGKNGTILTSGDGAEWAEVSSGAATENFLSLSFGADRFVAVGGEGTVLGGGASLIAFSTDGTNWMRVPPPTPFQLNDVVHGRNQFVAVGISGTVLSSTHGREWISRESGTWFPLQSVAYGNGTFVAVGGQRSAFPAQTGNILLFSSDGTNWMPRTIGTTNTDLAVRFVANEFMISDADGLTFSSSDGFEWRRLPDQRGIQPSAVAQGRGVFVGIHGATIYSSADGQFWSRSLQSFGGAPQLTGVAFGEDRFVVVGAAGLILQSDPLTGHLLALERGRVEGGQLRANIYAPPNWRLNLEASEDLVRWRRIGALTNTPPSSVVEIPSNTSPKRFYRLAPQ